MQDKISIVIADDHSLIRQGLKQVINTKTNCKIFEAENGEKAYKIIEKEQPMLAILDIEMPEMNGFDVAKAAKEAGFSTELIFLTMFKDETMFNKAMDIGVKGYVLKENTVSEIVKFIHAVLKGNYYLSPAISDFLVRRNLKPDKKEGSESKLNLLTPTERKVLRQVAKMKTSQEIADVLFVSVKTIQNHRNNICHKLDIQGSHALLKFSLKHKESL